MTARAVSFALSPQQLVRLLAAGSDSERVEIVQEEIEGAWEEEHLCELDKAWDAIHRCLTDGTLSLGDSPLALAILGGEQLHAGAEYILSLVSADRLPPLVEAMRSIDRADMRRRYQAMIDYDGPAGEDDFEYTWSYFEELVEFLARATSNARAVLFSVDQ